MLQYELIQYSQDQQYKLIVNRMINDLYYQRCQAHSLPFITYQPPTFNIHPQAAHYLNSLPPKPCHILAIVGKIKTGKSYLLNKLFNLYAKPNSEPIQYFPVSNNIQSCTKGINVLSSFIEFEDKIIILMDAQGLGNLGCNQAYESKLTAVVMLLSSTLIYNNIGAIDQQTLTNLGFLIDIGKMFEKSIVEVNRRIFSLPSLFMVLRDFSLTLNSKNNQQINAFQYLESALEQQKGVSQTALHKNRIRRTIKQLFQQRNCQTLVLPSEDTPITSLSETRPQFKNQLQNLWQKVNQQFKNNPKKINNKILKGKEYMNFIENMLQAINSNLNNFPKIDNIMVHIYRKQITEIQQLFSTNVKSIMKQFVKICKASDSLVQEWQNIQGRSDCKYKLKEMQEKSSSMIQFVGKIQDIYDDSCQQMHQLIICQGRQDVIMPNVKLTFNTRNITKIKQFKQLYELKGSTQETILKKHREMSQYMERQKSRQQEREMFKKQQERYNRIIENIYLINEQGQLDEVYRQFIGYFKDGVRKVSSEIFSNYLLRCEVAYLRRKLQLKNREEKRCTECKISQSNQSINKTPLGDISNKNQTSSQNKNRFQSNKQTSKQAYQFQTSKYQSEQGKLLQSQPSKWITPFKETNSISYKSFYIPYIVIEYLSSIQVEIIRTLIKQDSRHNNYTEYVMEILLYSKKWTFSRKWKDFNELHNILSNIFEQELLPAFDGGHVNVGDVISKQQVQIRRSKLQHYMASLLNIEPVRNSRIMQKFLKINKEYITNL